MNVLEITLVQGDLESLEPNGYLLSTKPGIQNTSVAMQKPSLPKRLFLLLSSP